LSTPTKAFGGLGRRQLIFATGNSYLLSCSWSAETTLLPLLPQPQSLFDTQSDTLKIALLQGRTPSQTTRATSIQPFYCKAERPLQPTRTTTCPPATIPCTGNRSRTPQLRTCEPPIPPLRTPNLRTSYKNHPTAPRPRTWKPSIPLTHYYNTGRTSGIRTYAVRTHLKNTLIPTSNLPKPRFPYVFLRFSSDFYTKLLRFPIYTSLS